MTHTTTWYLYHDFSERGKNLAPKSQPSEGFVSPQGSSDQLEQLNNSTSALVCIALITLLCNKTL